MDFQLAVPLRLAHRPTRAEGASVGDMDSSAVRPKAVPPLPLALQRWRKGGRIPKEFGGFWRPGAARNPLPDRAPTASRRYCATRSYRFARDKTLFQNL